MQIKFEPYVLEPYVLEAYALEPFNDWYQFPSRMEPLMDLIYQDYQMDLADLQRDWRQSIADAQREHQQRIADLQYQLMKDINASK